MLELLRKSWWTISLRGLFIVAFGVVAVLSPSDNVEGLGTFAKLGVMFLLSGGLLLFVGIAFRKKLSNWLLLVITALPDLALGMYFIFSGKQGNEIFARVMSIWILLLGLGFVFMAIRFKNVRILLGILGFICLGFGLFVYLNKDTSLLVVYNTINYFVVLLGIVIITLGFSARKVGLKKVATEPEKATGDLTKE